MAVNIFATTGIYYVFKSTCVLSPIHYAKKAAHFRRLYACLSAHKLFSSDYKVVRYMV